MPPGTPRACITPPPAPLGGWLTIKGGFTVIDPQQRRLQDRARALGFADLHGYLTTRCQHVSPAELAGELGTTTPVIRRLLNQACLTPSPAALSAMGRRHSTQQRLALRAAELGFPTLQAYLADRVVGQAWRLDEVTAELGTHARTLRRLLEHYQLRRARQTTRQRAAGQRGRQAQARSCQLRRATRLAALGFGDLTAYLEARYVQQGWSIRQIRAELRVGRAWLAGQIAQVGLRH